MPLSRFATPGEIGVDELTGSYKEDSATQAGATFKGWSRNVNETDAATTWKIIRETFVGGRLDVRFADDINDFIHQWANRVNLFPPVPFANSFSVQLNDEANSFGQVPDAPAISFANNAEFSFATWMKTTKTGTQTIVQKSSNSGGNNGYMFDLDSSGRLEFQFRGNGTGDRIRVRTVNPMTNLASGFWHLVGWTKATGLAASTVQLWVDGATESIEILNDTLTGVTETADPLNIGASFNGTTPRFRGNFDEMAFFNRELTSLEWQELYNNNLGVIDLANASPALVTATATWWRMGDGSFVAVPTIPDEIGSNDITLGSAVTGGDIETVVPP